MMTLLEIKNLLLCAIADVDQAADGLRNLFGEEYEHTERLKEISQELFEIEYDL